MPIPNPKLDPPPQPTRIFFDPFNSSSTGHQRAENRLSGSTSWRDSRSYKLSHQFRDTSGCGGQKHLSDLVGAGSENFRKDGRKDNRDWEVGASGLRESGWQDIRGLMGGSRKRSANLDGESPNKAVEQKRRLSTSSNKAGTLLLTQVKHGLEASTETKENGKEILKGGGVVDNTIGKPSDQPPQIFRNLTIYLNGTTAPLISDLRLKQIFAQHGGNASLALGRRTVTHVILGEGCGGGLASSKINKEVVKTRGKGIKYVTARWVIDSVEKGVRQSESSYVPSAGGVGTRLGGSGQTSVKTIFKKREADTGR